MNRTTVFLPEELLKKVKHYCVENGFTVTQLIKDCLEKEVSAEKKVVKNSAQEPKPIAPMEITKRVDIGERTAPPEYCKKHGARIGLCKFNCE